MSCTLTARIKRKTDWPWHVVGHNWQNTTIYDVDKTPICKMDLEDWDVTEDNQDELEAYQAKIACLIAAAPEMLKALELVAGWKEAGTPAADIVFTVVRSAIAKATDSNQ